MKKKDGKTVIVLLIIAAAVAIASKAGTSRENKTVFTDHKSGYAVCDYVKGITFDVPEQILFDATTVTVMSDSDDTYIKGTWIAKMGGDSYKAFNYDSFVIFAMRGTHFMDDGDIKSAVTTTSLDGTWFSPDKSKFLKSDSQGGYKKTVMSVIGDVSLNPQFYGAYAGRLAVITDGTHEWSLFMGVPAAEFDELSGDLKKTIIQVTGSMRYVGYDDGQEEVLTEKLEPMPYVPVSEPEPLPADDVIVIEETPSEAGSEEEISSADDYMQPDTSQPVQDVTEKENVTLIEEPPAEHEPILKEGDNPVMVLAKDSSPDRPLYTLGYGTVSLYDDLYAPEYTYVSVKKICEGDEAETILKNCCEADHVQLPATPEKTRLVLVEYSCGIDNSEMPVRSYITGCDGNELMVDDVPTHVSTHHVNVMAVKSSEGYSKYYLYFFMPKSVSDYLIEFGNQDLKKKAYFRPN